MGNETAKSWKFLCELFAVLALTWSQFFEHTLWHWLGDAQISNWLYSSGTWFAQNGFQSYGLPMYPGFQGAYTHITGGPDWIQALIAVLRPRSLPMFGWHAFVSAVLSLAALFWGFASFQSIARAMLPANQNINNAASAVLLLALSCASMQVFSAQPYAAGTLIADAVNLAFVAAWCRNPNSSRWPSTVALFSFSIFFSFWMGLSPVTSSAFWCMASAYRFGAPELRRRRVIQIAAAFAVTAIACVTLKILQNYLYFGSMEAVWKDMVEILRLRQGIRSTETIVQDYSFAKHLFKMAWRIPYLFGAIPFLVLFFGWKNWRVLAQEKEFLGLILLGGFSWQFAMRHHSFHHIYLFRFLMFPLCLVLTLQLMKEDTGNVSLRIKWLSALQLLLLWSVALIPAIR